MMAITKYWLRMASREEIRARAATATAVASPTHRWSRAGKTLTTLSAKPTTYIANDSASAK